MLLLTACSPDALTGPTATPTPSDTAPPPTATATPTDPPTATTLPTDRPPPAATDTPTPKPTPTATDTPTPTPTVMGVVRARQRVNLRGGPGITFAALASLAPGDEVLVSGQNEDGSWYQVRLEDGDEGWVSAPLLRVEGVVPAFAAPDSIPGEPLTIGEETRITVEVAQPGAGDEDSILIFDVPIADIDAMRATATLLVAEAATAAATAASPTPTALRRPTAAPTSPPATPRFGVNVFAFCDDPAFGIGAPQDLAAGSTIKIFWAWFAATEDYLRQHMSHATHELRVNGERINSVNQYRLDPSRSGAQHVVYWYVPHGPLSAGEYRITYRVTWRSAISDGYASFGPGTATEFEEESCAFVVR